MLVNLESGAFTGLPRGDYDEALDIATHDPGVYRHENSFQRRIHAGPGQIGEIGETQHLPGASCQG